MSASHAAQMPAVVYDYPGSWAAHPWIHSTFTEAGGWRRYGFRKRISRSWARKLRAEGVTVVALTDGQRLADFTVRELVR